MLSIKIIYIYIGLFYTYIFNAYGVSGSFLRALAYDRWNENVIKCSFD
jgi:hypothetical protein